MAKDTPKHSENKNWNWFTDPSLPLSEKAFHISTLVAGWIIFVFAIYLLKNLTRSTVHAPATVTLSIVSFLFILFSLFCISGRGLQVLTDLMEFSKRANHLKTLGVEMHRSDEIIKKIMEQEEKKSQS